MRVRTSWGSLLLIAAMAASFAGACSATHGSAFTTGGGGAGGASSASGSPSASSSGLFMTTGTGAPDAGDDASGPTVCDTSCTIAGGQCQSGTCVLTDNTGGLDPATQTSLTGGGSADPSFTFVYPYDHTVFPGGLLPPTLQFGGGAIDGAYVHVTFPGMDYKGFFAASRPAWPSRRPSGRPSPSPPRASRT